MKNPNWYARFAKQTARTSGRSFVFTLAVGVIGLWLITGPLFNFSDTWQLVINTGTTIVTFLMVFLIQNTQNRDTEAIQLKLDELIRSHKTSRNQLIDLENLSDAEMETIHDQFHQLHEKATHKRSGAGV